MFETYEYEIDLVAEPFGNLKYRNRTVLVLIKNTEGKYLFGAKDAYYPKGIVRMIGGGVEKDETPIKAAVRELKEEIGVKVAESDLQELIEVKVEGTRRGVVYKLSIFVCFLELKVDGYKAGDDVSEIVAFDDDESRDLVRRCFDLRSDNMFADGDNTFSWGDYGKVYGFVLQTALNKVINKW